MNQATNHGMDMNQGIGIRAYVARIRKARECSPDDLRYITSRVRNTALSNSGATDKSSVKPCRWA